MYVEKHNSICLHRIGMLSVLDNHDIFILALSLGAKTSQEETSQNYNTLEIGRMDAKNAGLQNAFGISNPYISGRLSSTKYHP